MDALGFEEQGIQSKYASEGHIIDFGRFARGIKAGFRPSPE
jgi:hypothetical protein